MSASISKKRKSTLRARQATLRAASNAFDSNARRARSATSRAGAPQGERDRSRAARAVMRPRAALRRIRRDFHVSDETSPRSGGAAAGARSALRRGAPEARARVSKRRISSLSFCTLLHFPSLTPLEFSPFRLKTASFGEHNQQKVEIFARRCYHAILRRKVA